MPSSNVHLVVIHHGLWGTPANTSFLTTTLAKFHGGTISPTSASTLAPPESVATVAAHAETHPNAKRDDVRMVLLNSGVNGGDHTYDGIDWCAERLVQDVYREVQRIEDDEEGKEQRVTKISLVGYSLGGLVVRYAAGVMFSDGFFASTTKDRKGQKGKELPFESRPIAASLSTIATPHLGVTLTGSTFSKVAKYVGSRSLGRSGKQLYLADRGWISSSASPSTAEPGASVHSRASEDGDEGLCLIEALSDPRFSFLRALRLFNRIDIYANAVADLTVSYRTAAFEPHDPFVSPSHLALTRDPDHPALLTAYAATTPEPSSRSFWQRTAGALSPSKLPWILNPQRFPFRFPLNYIAWVCLPVLLPVMLGLVLHKLRSDSRVSKRRVQELEQLWAEQNGHLPSDGDADADGNGKGKDKRKKVKLDTATRGRLERVRVAGLLAEVEAEVEETLREVGEDNVAQHPTTTTSPSPSSSSSSSSASGEESRYVVKPNTPTLALSPPEAYHIPTDEIPLTETQLRIARNLNNKTLLPQIAKHLAHFDDVLNAHAVIIVRTTTIETHKRGIPLIKAFAARFGI